MLTLPSDVARCKGRVWMGRGPEENSFLADECQTCQRWVAHYCHEDSDGPVAHMEPPADPVCPMRLEVAE